MIDEKYNVERYIGQYARKSDEFISKVELKGFDLIKFQKQFAVSDHSNPMFDCYPIKHEDSDFLKEFIADNIYLNFDKYEYFLEARNID